MHPSNTFNVIVLWFMYVGCIHSINCLVQNNSLSVAVFSKLFHVVQVNIFIKTAWLLIFYGTESFFSWQSFPFFLFPPPLICDSLVGCKEKLDAGHSWFLFTFFLGKVV